MSRKTDILIGAVVLAITGAYWLLKTQHPGGSQWVKSSELHPQPTAQSSLTTDQAARVRRLQAILADVDDSSLKKWTEDFEKDRDPEREILVWEAIADAYHSYCSAHTLGIDGKQDVLRVLLVRSETDDEQDVLRRVKLRVLTQSEAQEVVRLYKGASAPIQVEER